MAGSVPQNSESASFESPVRPAWVRWLCGIENSILIVCLFALIFLPLLERVMRGFFNTGIEGEAEFVLHFSLVIGMVGGAIAAREKRLLGILYDCTLPQGAMENSCGCFCKFVGSGCDRRAGICRISIFAG